MRCLPHVVAFCSVSVQAVARNGTLPVGCGLVVLGYNFVHVGLVEDRQLFVRSRGSQDKVYRFTGLDSKGPHAAKFFQLTNMEADDVGIENLANMSSACKEEPPRPPVAITHVDILFALKIKVLQEIHGQLSSRTF